MMNLLSVRVLPRALKISVSGKFNMVVHFESFRSNRDVDSLMIVERSGIKNDEFIVRASPATSLKNLGVRKIQYGRAFRVLHGSFSKPLLPNVIGRDHMIGKPS